MSSVFCFVLSFLLIFIVFERTLSFFKELVWSFRHIRVCVCVRLHFLLPSKEESVIVYSFSYII